MPSAYAVAHGAQAEVERLQCFEEINIDIHPVNEIAKILRRSESSVWHMLYRMGASAAMGRDGLTSCVCVMAVTV